MMAAMKSVELLSECIKLERCKSECQTQLAAMELAAVIQHEERLDAS